MNSSEPPEGPEHHTRTLSPVSPKPLHFPSPANIPILEKSMDPSFDASAAADGQAADDNQQPGDDSQNLGASHSTHHIAFDDVKEDDDTDKGVTGATGTEQDAFQSSLDASYSADPVDNQTIYDLSAAQLPTAPLSNFANDPSYPSAPPAVPFQMEHSNLPGPDSSSDHADMATTSHLAHPAAGPNAQAGIVMGQAASQPEGGTAADRANAVAGGIDYQALLDNLSSVSNAAPPPNPLASAAATAEAHAADPGSASAATVGPLHVDTTATAPGVADALTSGQAPDGSLNSATLATPLAQALAGLPARPPPLQGQTSSQTSSHQLVPPYPLQTTVGQQAYPPGAPTGPASATSAAPGTTYLGSPGNAIPQAANEAAPGTTSTASGLGPPPVATFQQQQAGSADPNYRQREPLVRRGSDDGDKKDTDEVPWPAEVQKLYDEFLQEERGHVTKGQWDRFPPNSRLFIGNLPTEKVTKRDLFHVFHKHGRLAQISIKQAYGFIQYLEGESCLRAMAAEQGVAIRGRKIHLEISKPQKSNNKNSSGSGGRNANRRSRSPDYAKGGGGGTSGNNGSGNSSGAQRADRYRGTGNSRRDRRADEYRPGRSPSPRARGSRNENRRDRSGDRYNGRRRSRSRSPRGRGGRRSSPPSHSKYDDDCPLPRREPAQVPDVQIIAKGELDRAFVNYVEKGFGGRGVRSDVLFLNPRLDESAVMRRQIIEGVIAVMKLDRDVQTTQQFRLSVFDRSAGEDKVKFEEYNNLTLHVCTELVLRAKQTARPPAAIAASVYGLPISQSVLQQQQQRLPHQQPSLPMSLPPFGQQQQPPLPIPPPNAPLDTSSLQKLLGRVQQQSQMPQQQQVPPPVPIPGFPGGQLPMGADLSRLLASASAASAGRPGQNFQFPPQPQQQPQAPQQQQQQQFPNLANNQAISDLLASFQQHQRQQIPGSSMPHQRHGSGILPQQQAPRSQQHHQPQQQHQQQQQSQPDMQSIMAQLANYNAR